MAFFILDAGISTVSWPTVLAFLILVSISAIGSVIVITVFLLSSKYLPACFSYARNFALVGQFSETDTANAVLADISMWSATDFASVVLSC